MIKKVFRKNAFSIRSLFLLLLTGAVCVVRADDGLDTTSVQEERIKSREKNVAAVYEKYGDMIAESTQKDEKQMQEKEKKCALKEDL